MHGRGVLSPLLRAQPVGHEVYTRRSSGGAWEPARRAGTSGRRRAVPFAAAGPRRHQNGRGAGGRERGPSACRRQRRPGHPGAMPRPSCYAARQGPGGRRHGRPAPSGSAAMQAPRGACIGGREAYGPCRAAQQHKGAVFGPWCRVQRRRLRPGVQRGKAAVRPPGRSFGSAGPSCAWGRVATGRASTRVLTHLETDP